MLIEAAKDLNFDLPDAVFVGDKVSDLAAARAAGCRAVLARTGYGQQVETDLLAQGKGGLLTAVVIRSLRPSLSESDAVEIVSTATTGLHLK